jgi:phosphotriesterase-related protein
MTAEPTSQTYRVQSVTGDLDPTQLGPTLMHEHVFLGYPGWDQDTLYEFDSDAEVSRVVESVSSLKRLGVRTLVDCTPLELGRFPGLLKTVSETSGINIICATGMYHGGVGLHTYWRMKSVDEVADVFVHDIETGVGDERVRAGILKVGTRVDKIVPHEEKVIRAAAMASVQTGVPITTHTESGQLGPDQLALMTAEGVSPERVVIGHLDNAPSLDEVRRVLDLGAYVGFDQIGYEFRVTDEARLDSVAALVKDGYASQLILSQDRVALWLGRLTDFLRPFQEAVDREGFTLLHDKFLPGLLERGVSQGDIDTMLVANPARYFFGTASS